jgi:hypothetical protein
MIIYWLRVHSNQVSCSYYRKKRQTAGTRRGQSMGTSEAFYHRQTGRWVIAGDYDDDGGGGSDGGAAGSGGLLTRVKAWGELS